MNLILLINDKPGGAEQVFREIAKYYLSKNEQIVVCFMTNKSTDYWDNIGLSNSNTIYFNQSIIAFLKFFLTTKNIRVLFTTHIYLTGLIGILKRLRIVKSQRFVGRESTSVFMRYKGFKLLSYRLMYVLGYSKLDLLICQTSLMKNQLLKHLPRLANKVKIEVIPNPFNIPLPVEDLSVQQIKNDYGDYIVSAGRLIPEKGFDILIDSFSKLKRVNRQINLVILGDGKERRALESKIHALGLKDSIFLIGFVDNVYPYFKGARLCVVSSRIEGFPNVLLQMMSQNENVISTNCAGDISDIVGVGLAKTEDVDNLYELMKVQLINNQSARSTFDIFLSKRSIVVFVQSIEKLLNGEKV